MYGVQEIAKLVTASQNDGRLVVNHVNPGWVSTSVMREWSGVKLAMFKLACKIAARTTEEGSRTLVNAAEGGEETHGEYLDDCQIGK